MTRCILAIDPGISGALCFYWPEAGQITVEDMPVAGGVVNGVELGDRIRQMAPTEAVIELVGARPGQGVSSMFNFGRSFGIAIGAVQSLHVPLEFVTPGRWKKRFRLGAEKEDARRRAIELFPAAASHLSRKKDAGRAEAALLARFYAEERDARRAAA